MSSFCFMTTALLEISDYFINIGNSVMWTQICPIYDQEILLFVVYPKEMSTCMYKKYDQNFHRSIIFNRHKWVQPSCFFNIEQA